MESRTQVEPAPVAAPGPGPGARWDARRQGPLHDPRAREHRVSRSALVAALLAEGCAAEAEVAGFAASLEDPASLSIGQVLRFVDGLRVRMALARTDDEVLQLACLRRDAEELAERMMDWAHTGRLPA
ncbi:hypothetical protein D7X55_35750 [Corallococcus sp. AB049A]|uniref:hypothetical protein n=1 Tax=Corallococcus sp. AB049A TaxID=2316721 RepID=UPI000EEC956D|nr:hypothetical protein [Corallococcus sp. AB049A]RKI49472.1 hypothetical protein D7X55_35750 [Corallococcus sp. AB049A]